MKLKDLRMGDIFTFATLGTSRTYMLLNQPTHARYLRAYLEDGNAALLLSLDDLRVCKDQWTVEVDKVD